MPTFDSSCKYSVFMVSKLASPPSIFLYSLQCAFVYPAFLQLDAASKQQTFPLGPAISLWVRIVNISSLLILRPSICLTLAPINIRIRMEDHIMTKGNVSFIQFEIIMQGNVNMNCKYQHPINKDQ